MIVGVNIPERNDNVICERNDDVENALSLESKETITYLTQKLSSTLKENSKEFYKGNCEKVFIIYQK